MDTDVKTLNEKTGMRNIQIALIGAAFAVICLLFLLMFTWFQPDQLSLSDRYFPSPTATFTKMPTGTPTNTLTPTPVPTHTHTPTATITPTPHVLLTPPPSVTVFEETFDANPKGWNAIYSNNTMRVKDGKLFINSKEIGYVGAALCYGCVRYGDTFYFQSELVLEKAIPLQHGLVFCAAVNNSDYYTFMVNQQYGFYTLYKHTGDNWETLIYNADTNAINKYPASNTLSVYFEKGRMDLYINNILVESYTDKNPFSCEWAGVIVYDGTIKLLADNVFSFIVKPDPASPTPTP